MGMLARKPVAPSRTPARAALAEVIQANRDHEAERIAADKAVERARAHDHACRERLSEAHAALAEAKTQHARDMIAAIGEGRTLVSNRIAEARAAVSAAEDEAATARDVLANIKARAEQLARPRTIVDGTKDAAIQVVKAECDATALIARTDRLQRELFDATAELGDLVGHGVIDSPRSVEHGQDWPLISVVMRRMNNPMSQWPFIDRDIVVKNTWKDAIARLMTDADAPLPE